MGGCASKLLQDDVGTERYSKHGQWPQPGLGEGLGAGGFGMGAAAAAPTNYSTTANVGLGRGEERVFLRDPPVGGLQLPRIEEDQAQQGQESPTKSQLTVPVSAQHLGGGGDKGIPAQQQPLNWTRGELIGQGAFGSVYLGMDNDSGQLMAVKQVHINKAASDRGGKLAENLRSLEAEVQLLQQLNHPNIVRYLGTERTDAALNIFLEYVPGGSIASLLAKFGSFRESVIKVYTKQILLGLEYLHQNGIMHRDIKGANILVDNTGLVKLADFGASKKIEDLVTIEEGYKTMKGTPNWMAPEVITGTGHGRQADIWSVACTVIEMATGRPPWSQFGSQVSAMFHIASSKGPPTIPENLSPDCKDFLYLCFNRSWKERPSASRLLQHSFLADVICRTVAAPLNNIANVVQEPSIKAWRAPKSVRVPSPMREESEGLPFSTPSPLHPRIAERAAGAARISTATSQGASDGDGTPGAAVAGGGGAAQGASGAPELPLSPLGQHPGGRKHKASVAGGAAATPRATAGAGVHQQQGRLPQRSPGKPRPSLRASAPALRGYASVALANSGGVTPRPNPPAQLEQPDRPAVVINSAASTVQPRDSVLPDAPLLGQQSSCTISRESSLAAVEAATAALRSSGSLRSSREQPAPAGADRVTVELGRPTSTAAGASSVYEAYQGPLRPQEAETPIPAKRASHSRIQTAAGEAGLPVAQESCTPSTGDSRGTFKSDYNPMEEPSWMHSLESPLDEGAPCHADGSPNGMHGHPSEATPQAASAPRTSEDVAPAEASAQPAQPAEQEQHHMVWMDDDGSIDALPWDIGSWSVGSKDGSPAGAAEAGQGGTTAGANGAASPGEPVGQEVLITALNRRAHMEVRASLALFESTLKSLNVPKLLAEGTPSPKGQGKSGALPALDEAAAASQAATNGRKAASVASTVTAQPGLPAGKQLPALAPQLAGPGMHTHPKKEDLASLGEPGGKAGFAERRQAVPGMAAYPGALPGALPEPAPGAYGGREAVWEQELCRELSQFGQLPSQWRYTAGRRASMHGSPQKAALAAGQQ